MTTDRRSPLLPRDVILVLAVYGLALALRLPLHDADYFSDETLSFHFSQLRSTAPENLHYVHGEPWPFYPKSWFFERPAFYLALAPGAWVSFEAYRVLYILFSSTLAPLAYLLLRERDAHPAIAGAAGVLVAVHPQFVVWGTIVHMDSLMMAFLAAGLWLHTRRHDAAAGVFLVLAAWTKEVAIFFIAITFLFELVRHVKAQRRLVPLALDPWSTVLLASLLFALVPFYVAQELGFGLPGEPGTGQVPWLVDHLFLSLWLLPLVLLGLAWRRSREAALWALAFPAFYLLLHGILHHKVREWYLIGPAFLAVVAAALAVDEVRRRAGADPRWLPRLGAATLAIGLAVALSVPIASGVEVGNRWLNPVSGLSDASLRRQLEDHERRYPADDDLFARLAEAAPLPFLVTVDVRYGLLYHPIPQYAREIRGVATDLIYGNDELIDAVAAVVEADPSLTVVEKRANRPNEGLRSVYADCKTQENDVYVLIEGAACRGRAAALRERLAFPLEAAA